MGVRALLEQIMVSTCGDKGRFDLNLEAFEKEGHVSKRQRERLEAILDVGHASIHRGFRPRREDVITLVDIAESVVQSVYVHDGKVDALKKRVPPRPPRGKG